MTRVQLLLNYFSGVVCMCNIDELKVDGFVFIDNLPIRFCYASLILLKFWNLKPELGVTRKDIWLFSDNIGLPECGVGFTALVIALACWCAFNSREDKIPTGAFEVSHL